MDHSSPSAPEAEGELLPPGAPLPERLIFILGPHRSGTTYLHRALARTGLFDFVTYYDIVEFDRLLTNERLNRREAVLQELEKEAGSFGPTRDFDQSPTGPLQPEEYGYLLERGPAAGFHRSMPMSNTEFGPLRRLCQKKRHRSAEAKALLLKNPTDFYDGFLRLEQNFPGSAYVFIHRHPLSVLNSQVTAWRRLLERPNPWYARLDTVYRQLWESDYRRGAAKAMLYRREGLEQIAEVLCRAFEFYLSHVHELPASNALSARYEDLCSPAANELGRLISWLAPAGSPAHPGGAAEPRPLNLLPDVAEVYRDFAPRMGAYLERLGYSTEPAA